MARAHESSPAPRLGGKTALATFVAMIFAFVAESQLTQYVQTSLGYQHSFFLFYIVHSSFILLFPLHLGYLLLTTHHSFRPLLSNLSSTISTQLTSRGFPESKTIHSSQFPLSRFLVVVLIMTAFYSIPALLWFVAIVYAPVTDVTAIWDANAFFAYVFSVKLLNLKWGFIRMCAVFLATAGVLIIVYAGSTPSVTQSEVATRTPAPFVGDLLTLVASVVYGLYQVLYKKYVALPSNSELAAGSVRYTHIPTSVEQAIDEETLSPPLLASNEIAFSLPFGLHPNFLTTCIGVCTLFVLWIPIPILHYYGIEEFALPSNMVTVAAIAGICAAGVVFNAGFMILLGVWGPIVTSVGNLLTIVLTLISDLLLGSVGLTAGGLLGAGMIVGAFTVLAYDMFQS